MRTLISAVVADEPVADIYRTESAYDVRSKGIV